MRLRFATVALSLALVACKASDSSDRAAASASAAPLASSESLADPPSTPGRTEELRALELSRVARGFRESDATDRAVAVRRAFARALARLRLPAARDRLVAALSDDDAEVVAWAAYGLGDLCATARDATVAALVARGLHVRDVPMPPAAMSASAAITRAIGRCASDDAEKVLLDWARSRSPDSEDALRGLGDIANQRGRLKEDTCIALLELAAGSATSKPWAFALAPLGRVTHLPPSVVEHAREVAVLRLGDGGADRIHAIRALGRTDDGAVASLVAELVAEGKSTPAERSEAARALGRLGSQGQRGLREALAKFVPESREREVPSSLVGPEFGAVLTALEALHDIDGARSVLDRYAKLDVPSDANASLLRRASQLRCASSRLVAERDFDYPLLTHCDRTAPKGEEGTGMYGGRAMVAAIGIEGTQLVAKRLKAWQRYASSADALARAAAIRLIADHPELEDPEAPLAAALESNVPGVIAAAAEVIAKHPERIRGRDDEKRRRGSASKRRARGGDVTRISKALRGLLDAADANADLEVLMLLIDAAGALGFDGSREALTRLCPWPNALLREHVEHALASVVGGDAKPTCPAPESGLPLPEELRRLVSAPTKLVFESDAGELGLELDPTYAPVAVTRVVELAKAGFYDGLVVHRVVPGFVTQVGSPFGDGLGGAKDRPALACETSPIPFVAGSVGMALAGRDTASSQFFVTHADYPHLDGQYAWIGRSAGAWAGLVEGDRIVHVRVSP